MEKYIRFVEKHRAEIFAAEDYIWANPETGYREWKTHKYLVEAFEKLGYTLTLAGNIPGFTAELDTGRPGPTLAIMGEMDSLICFDHPEADPETGAVHACGHCAQVAALVGIAGALKEPGALDGLSGKIRLVVVPAEELIEVGYRKELQEQGIIKYFGGKPEFMRRGLLDGVDLAMMVHTGGNPSFEAAASAGSNGCLAKEITFEGVAAHAGGSPHMGVNALYAANLAMNAINALRETFRDDAHIRVHPIITAGGDAVNAIPNCVKMESYVRGATMDDIVEVNRKVNRAIAASAAAIGAKVRINDIPGYWPRLNEEGMTLAFKEAAESVGLKFTYNPSGWGTGCSDMGDIGAVMPSCHPHIGGATGKGHGNDYIIADPESACVSSAKMQVATAVLLMKDGAQKAKQIVESYKPVFASFQDYFDFMDKLNMDRQAVSYEDGSTVTLTYSQV